VKSVCAVAVTVAFLILAGCNTAENSRNPREMLALAGVASLREAFNQGACKIIFDDADEVFRISQPETDWLELCGRLHKSLGWWRSFQARLDHTNAVPLRVVVYGEAEFAKGRYHLWTVWHFDWGRAQLFSMALQGTREQIVIPPPAIRMPRKLMDPPPITANFFPLSPG